MDSHAVVWFRRDLRLGDNPAISAAAERAKRALALYVLDAALLERSGAPRAAFLSGCLRSLDEQLDGRLLVVTGKPKDVVPRVTAEVGAASVHIAADAGPYGRERDKRVEKALQDNGTELVRTGSPYAITPGRVRKQDGEPFRVFTPFSRAWADHGWRAPADTDVSTVDWVRQPGGEPIPDGPATDAALPEPGEPAALRAWAQYRDNALGRYDQTRNRPDLDATSRMSAYLRWGCVHPRTLLADLTDDDTAYRNELCWREFYADVLWHWPESARWNFNTRFDKMTVDDGPEARERFADWASGHTGYPIVDAGMRQLLAEGWMHNRVRMITASFLVKDLHLPWQWGARHFMRHLVDGDLASNQHGWQWVAGSGTDAAPYFRVFNPTTQGKRFDPDGDYIHRYVPELSTVDAKELHTLPVPGYVAPMVDHAEERRLTLDRYAATG